MRKNFLYVVLGFLIFTSDANGMEDFKKSNTENQYDNTNQKTEIPDLNKANQEERKIISNLNDKDFSLVCISSRFIDKNCSPYFFIKFFLKFKNSSKHKNNFIQKDISEISINTCAKIFGRTKNDVFLPGIRDIIEKEIAKNRHKLLEKTKSRKYNSNSIFQINILCFLVII